MIQLLGEDKKELIDFNDPFSKDKIERVNFYIGKGIFSGKIEYDAVVEFKFNNTSGKQKFEAEDFPSLVTKVQSFINSL